MRICSNCQFSFESKDWTCPSCGKKPVEKNGFLFFAPALSEGVNFPTDSFDRLVKYEDCNFWFRSRSALIVSRFKKYFSQAENLLEVGCGNGYVLSCVSRAVPGLRLFGSEVNEQGLAYAAKRMKDAQFFQMDARHIPFASEFDVIGLFDVLEHIEEDEEVLASIHQALKPNGGLVLTVPQHQFLWTYIDDFSGHKRRYNAKELRAKVEKAGFQIEETISFVTLLMPLMLLSRLLRSNTPEKFDPENELRISPLLNFLLEQVLSFERLLIRWGVRFPWGGSLFLVARKR